MFQHGGFMHLAGNMLFLWIFGDNPAAGVGVDAIRTIVCCFAADTRNRKSDGCCGQDHPINSYRHAFIAKATFQSGI